MERPNHINFLPLGEIRNPYMFDRFRERNVFVTDADSIVVNGIGFKPDVPLRVGEEITLSAPFWALRAHYVSEVAAYEAYRIQKKEKDRLDRIERERAEKEQYRLDSAKFWAEHADIPFRFSLEIKERLSGLSANSSGNGHAANTVTHIYLKEDYTKGKFKRFAGDFLCTPTNGRHGGDWSGTLGEDAHRYTFDDEGVRRIPTCKQCLKALERFRKPLTPSV